MIIYLVVLVWHLRANSYTVHCCKSEMYVYVSGEYELEAFYDRWMERKSWDQLQDGLDG